MLFRCRQGNTKLYFTQAFWLLWGENVTEDLPYTFSSSVAGLHLFCCMSTWSGMGRFARFGTIYAVWGLGGAGGCGLWGLGGGCSLTFGEVAGFLHGCFSRFLNCTNDTKSCKASQSVNLTSIFTASRAFLQGCLIIIDYDELLVVIVWLSWTIARNPNHLKLWHVVGEVRT